MTVGYKDDRQDNCAKSSSDITIYDFIQLVIRGRNIFIISLSISLIFGFVYLKYSPQTWVTDAVLTEPSYNNIIPLKANLSDLYAVVAQDKKKKLDDLISKKDIFESFIDNFSSFDNKKMFLSSLPEYKEISGENEKMKRAIFIEKWVNKISLLKIKNEDKYNNEVSVKFKANTSDKSYEYLESYIEFINDKVLSDLKKDIDVFIDEEKSLVKSKLLSLYERAKLKQKMEIEKNEFALRIAGNANLEKPLKNNIIKTDFPFQMGTLALEEQIKVLRRIKDFSIFEPEIPFYVAKEKMLNKMSSNDIITKVYTYLNSPEPPLKKSSPNSLFILVLVIAFGFFFGFLFTVLKSEIKFSSVLKKL